MTDPNFARVSTEDLLQDGVSHTLAVLAAIEGAGMLQNLPANHGEAALHNHALHLLCLLEASLRRLQAEVDERGANWSPVGKEAEHAAA